MPFIIYADFETVLKKVFDPKLKATFQYQNHVPSGYAWKRVCFYDDKPLK